MGVLDNSTLTTDAILTTRGRELLSTYGTVDITKFALSDEEIDYTLHDRKHASGTNSFGVILENATLLEASPGRSKLGSYIRHEAQESQDIILSRLNYPGRTWDNIISVLPETVGPSIDEDYEFTIENPSVVKFRDNPGLTTRIGPHARLRTQIFGAPSPNATTTVTVRGIISEIIKVISITVIANPDANAVAKQSTSDVTDPKFY
jgi:hypothetical protein